MRIASADLNLDRLDVIHIGKDTYPLTEGIRAVAFDRLHLDLAASHRALHARPRA